MLRVKGWSKFQHYKDRRPPWIKLSRELLENYDWFCLQDASKALIICIWLLASENEKENFGYISDDPVWLGFRSRMEPLKVVECIKDLVKHGFLEHKETKDSNLLSPCYQDATPEAEAEAEAEAEDLRGASPRKNDDADDVQVAVDAYNDLAKGFGLPEAQVISQSRKSKLRNRIKEAGGIDGWIAAMEKASQSNFLMGKSKEGWKASLDFFLQKGSFIKLMEGNYDNRTGRTKSDETREQLAEWATEEPVDG